MLFTEVLKHIYREDERTVGRAVFAAKCSVIARYPTNDNYYGPAVLWTLFGDPALRVKHRALTGIEEGPTPHAERPTLDARPNPTRAGLSVSYVLPVAGRVNLRLYDESGVLVSTILSGHRDAGAHLVRVSPPVLRPGVYFVKLEAGRADLVQKFAVVR